MFSKQKYPSPASSTTELKYNDMIFCKGIHNNLNYSYKGLQRPKSVPLVNLSLQRIKYTENPGLVLS